MLIKLNLNFFYDKQVGSDCKATIAASDGIYISNKDLDFTLLTIEPFEGLPKPIKVPTHGKPFNYAKEQRCNIIGHPNGDPKQIAVQKNTITDIFENKSTLHYTTDTQKGSSGSPVFNNKWELIALHHKAGQSKIEDGNPIWITNEGIIFDKIIEYLFDHHKDVYALLCP